MSTYSNNKNLSESKTVEFFNNYFSENLTVSANEFDTVFSWFKKKGFDDVASKSITQILLNQAKKDSTNIFKILDTMNSYSRDKISFIVAKILNATSGKTSKLGFESDRINNPEIKRNLVI
jgi:hypothetical protein